MIIVEKNELVICENLYFGMDDTSNPDALAFSELLESYRLVNNVECTTTLTGDTYELSEMLKVLLASLDLEEPLHLRILYEEVYEDVMTSLSALYRKKDGVMTYTYQNAMPELGHLLSPSVGKRLLLLLCSPEAILNVFEKIQEEELDSHFVPWLVVLDNRASLEQVVSGLQGKIDEGTQVLLLKMEEDMRVKVFLTRPDPQKILRFQDQGTWDILSQQRMKLLSTLLMANILDEYSDLKGREMIVGAQNNLPVMRKMQIDPDGNVIPAIGMDIGILETLSPILNFTYRFVEDPDGWGGPLPNGTAIGLIGMVVRKEATFALSGMSIIGQREDIVDMSCPYYEDSLNLVSRAPQKLNPALAAFTPFSFQVWILMIAVTLCMGPILKIVSMGTAFHLHKEETNHKLQVYSFNVFRSIVTQGNMIKTKFWPLRLIFICWYLVCIVVSALYSGTLTAFLAIPSYEKPIDNLNDLPRAVEEGFIVGTVKDTVIEYILRGANEGLYKQTWDLLHHEDLKQSLLPNPTLGFNKILEEKFVFIAPAAVSVVAATTRGREQFHLGRGRFYPLRYGIAFHTGSPLKDRFSHLLLRLTEGGLVNKWKDDAVLKITKFSKVSDKSITLSPITLSNIQAAFYVLTLGLLTSTVALLIENMSRSHHRLNIR
ncbi:glutamate receptor ionotropic, delta-1-like [Palaemon carinicauda]|uniref:glutamate receptor ionotropic, delta-1-like n=1 Tax=Palaemon carinicauda TaxID=392227 RepID=UPI0035B60F9B